MKLIQYKGLAAHAGSAPHKGINAMNAALLAPAAIHAQRETFKDKDAIRVHVIITWDGDLVKVDLLYGNAEKAKEISVVMGRK